MLYYKISFVSIIYAIHMYVCSYIEFAITVYRKHHRLSPGAVESRHQKSESRLGIRSVWSTFSSTMPDQAWPLSFPGPAGGNILSHPQGGLRYGGIQGSLSRSLWKDRPVYAWYGTEWFGSPKYLKASKWWMHSLEAQNSHFIVLHRILSLSHIHFLR